MITAVPMVPCIPSAIGQGKIGKSLQGRAGELGEILKDIKMRKLQERKGYEEKSMLYGGHIGLGL